MLALDDYITSFTAKLQYGDDFRSEADQNSLVARTLARAALIQLYSNSTGNDSRPHDACMAAATSALAVVEHLNVNEFGHLDPIMAVSFDSTLLVVGGRVESLNDSSFHIGRFCFCRLVRFLSQRLVESKTLPRAKPQVAPTMTFT